MENWGYFIRKLRKERGYTQAELAQRAELLPSHISRIEKGTYKSPKQATFEKLANALGLLPAHLSQIIKGREMTGRKETPEQILDRLRLDMPFSVPIYEEFKAHAGEEPPIDFASIKKERARGKTLEGYISSGECLEPDIQEGDIIIIDRGGEIGNGDLVVYLLEGKLHIARLRQIAGELWVENNFGRTKLGGQMAAPVVEVRRRLK